MSKRKVNANSNADGEEDLVEDSGPDYSAYMSRVLLRLRVRSPISKADLGAILQDTPDDFNFTALWEYLKKSVYTRYDENGDKLWFEHELQNVSGQNLKDFIDKRRGGVSREELLEFNKELVNPITELLRTCSVLSFLGWRDSNRKCLMMYPRGTDFKVPLSGTLTGKTDVRFLETSQDLRPEIRRGDAIVIDGIIYRVSVEETNFNEMTLKELRELVKELGGDIDSIEERDILEAKAHELWNDKSSAKKTAKKQSESGELLERINEFSSSSYKELPTLTKRQISYKYDFDAKRIPIDRPLKATVDGVTAYKYGCSNDIREAYWRVADDMSNKFLVRDSDRLDLKISGLNLISDELLQGMNQNNQERRELHAKRLADAAKGGPKKRQNRQNFMRKVTNTHME